MGVIYLDITLATWWLQSGSIRHVVTEQAEGARSNELPGADPTPTYFQAVCSSQQHSQKAAKHISDGVTGIVDKVQVLLVYWENKYKAIWETDKDAFIR